MERVQSQVLVKANLEELQSLSQKVADKSWVSKQLSSFVSKPDFESTLKQKVELSEFNRQNNHLQNDI